MKANNEYTKAINWKLFYRNVFALVIPIAIQNLINVGVTATAVIMLGKVGDRMKGEDLGDIDFEEEF